MRTYGKILATPLIRFFNIYVEVWFQIEIKIVSF